MDGARAYAMDFGAILGNNKGFQITVAKTGILKKKHNKSPLK